MELTLILEDGSILKGKSFGAQGETIGEIVFNTSMTGYQEIITDPSYHNQIIVMTYPEIGNYGLNDEDFEAKIPYCKGFIVKNYCRCESHYKSTKTLSEYFKENGIIAGCNFDTRSLAQKIREKGSMKCLLTTENTEENTMSEKFAKLATFKNNPDILFETTPKENYEFNSNGDINLAFIDFGSTKSVMEELSKKGCKIKVFKPDTKAEEILEGNFDCVFLSNGVGNPKDYEFAVEEIKKLLGKIPMFGISLGCGLLALSLGADVYKLKHGHRGTNYPVMNLKTNKVLMTSQNHNWAIDEKSLTGLMNLTYKNLNDETIEGFNSERLKIHSVQFYPEITTENSDDMIYDEWVKIMKEEKKHAKV